MDLGAFRVESILFDQAATAGHGRVALKDIDEVRKQVDEMKGRGPPSCR